MRRCHPGLLRVVCESEEALLEPLKLLAIDDDDLILQSLRIAAPQGWKVTGWDSFKDLPEGHFHAAFVDMHLTGNLDRAEGIEVIRKLHEQNPRMEIVAMSGDMNRDLMEKSLKAGASRYLAKPLNADEIVLTLEKIEAYVLLVEAATRKAGSQLNWIGSSPESSQVKKWIASLKGEVGPILIEGESGTGKEVVAQLLHQQNQTGPIISVNVAAIPENLFESEFFGHVRGAFTGAQQNKMGLAEAAHGGDLFLDEIEALSMPLQAKLLRFLESGEIRRVGASESIRVKTRVIVATNRNLDQMVRENQFREDLLFRLSGKKIVLPPLKKRTGDLADLCQFFFSQDPIRKKKLEEDGLLALAEHPWPGNVRELKRVCEQLLVQSPLPMIRKEDVLACLGQKLNLSSDLQTESFDFHKGLAQVTTEFESLIIQRTLAQIKDIDEAAKVLQISRSSLYKKIKDHNIEWRES